MTRVSAVLGRALFIRRFFGAEQVVDGIYCTAAIASCAVDPQQQAAQEQLSARENYR